MRKTVNEIAEFIGGELVGSGQGEVSGFAGLKEASPRDVSFLANPKYSPLLKETRAAAVIVGKDVAAEGLTLIRVPDPSRAFSRALELYVEECPGGFSGIHSSAVIADDVSLADDVTVGPHAVIDAGVKIAAGSRIGAGCFIGSGSRIGAGCRIYPQVSILTRTRIGESVVIHSGTVIGSDGFGFATDEKGIHHKIPQIGYVEIQDHVEIGSNVSIDRARFDKTVIGEGTKIDNLVQIAHNVRIGKGCLIVSQVGISGSTVIEDYVVLGGQVGVAGHLTVGQGTRIAAQSGVAQSVPEKSVLFGSPAQPHMQAKRANAYVNKLPDYIKQIRDLKARVVELERKSGQL
ncbi:MAG: UDP-3-O-(3-hydroxymyristoyl)glucosamine N-acyltransferase [Candidatus Omnitrophota bacterium]